MLYDGQYEEEEEEDDGGSSSSGLGNRVRKANSSSKPAKTSTKAAKAGGKAAKAAGRAVATAAKGIGKAVVSLLSNPYVLIPLIIILIAAVAYFVVKDEIPDSATSTAQSSIEELAESETADEQTAALLQTYEQNRSFLTATIKDVNKVYTDYIERLSESDPANALDDFTAIFGSENVELQEMRFQSEPSKYFTLTPEESLTVGVSQVVNTTQNTATAATNTATSSVIVNSFLSTAERIWKQIYNGGYSYSTSAQYPYNSGVIDCSGYVSWVLAEAGYDISDKDNRLDTTSMMTYDWSKFGFEVIEFGDGANLIDILQPADILVRRGHCIITAYVQDGVVYAYDCGAKENWTTSGGVARKSNHFAADKNEYGNSNAAGIIIRVGQASGNIKPSSSVTTTENTATKEQVVKRFLDTAERLWKKVYNGGYTYSTSAQYPYNSSVIDCSAYVSWVLAESGYDISDVNNRLYTGSMMTYDWSKFGFEVIEFGAGANVIDILQPGDILVRRGSSSGHCNITAYVQDGVVYAYDCGSTENWTKSGGVARKSNWFASGEPGNGSSSAAGIIIRLGQTSGNIEPSSSVTITENKTVLSSSKVNSAATTSEYPTDSAYVLPTQSRELYKHMLLTEKYNFNMINWKLYKAQGSGASRTLPTEGSDSVEYTVEPALGLRVPKSDEKTVDYFIQLVEPYLQSNLIPISMYSMSITSEGNVSKNDVRKNAEFAYAIIKEAYSDITMNIYELEHYTENWSHEEWDIANGVLEGQVHCIRMPTNLYSLCEEERETCNTVTDKEAMKAWAKDNPDEKSEWENFSSFKQNIIITSYKAKIIIERNCQNDCESYDKNKLLSTLPISDIKASNEKLKNIASTFKNSDAVEYEYMHCKVQEGYEANKDQETITEKGLKTEDVLVSSSTEKDVEYKPYRVKAFDIVLEYEYDFEVYNTANSPDSISTSSVDLPDRRTSISINTVGYEAEALTKDCADDGNVCDGIFNTIVGTYTAEVNRQRKDTVKNWNDKLSAASEGYTARKYHIDDVIEFIDSKQDESVSLSKTAQEYYEDLDTAQKINRIDLINSVSTVYNSYIDSAEDFGKNIAIKQDGLEYSYSVLIDKLREIQKDETLPYIYGQTLGLNLKFTFDEDKTANCNTSETSTKGGYTWPVPNNYLISALFGYTPIYGGNHEGIDIWADANCSSISVDIVAAKSGTVYSASDIGIPSNLQLGSGEYGNHIILKHDDGKYTLYGHLETGTFEVSTGEYVKAGQVIAKMGSSGNSSGWHLHFNISKEPYSSCEDPLLYYNVEPTSSVYPEYSKVNKNNITEFNAYKFVSSKSVTGGPTSLDGFLFIGDSSINTISSELSSLGNGITVVGVNNSKQSEWISVVNNSSGAIQGQSVTLPADPTGISVSLGINEINSTSKMDELLETLLSKYPNKKIYVNSVLPVASTYTYSNASALNSQIKSFNEHIKSKCNSSNNLVYIDVSTGLIDSSGYLKSNYVDSTGQNLSTTEAKKTLAGNIKNGIFGIKTNTSTSSSSSGDGINNIYSAASEMAKVDGVGTQVNTERYKVRKQNYWNYIVKYADLYEVDPYLILAIITHEIGGLENDENYVDIRTSEANKAGYPSQVVGLGQKTTWPDASGVYPNPSNNVRDKNGNTFGSCSWSEFIGNAELQIKLCCAEIRGNMNLWENDVLAAVLGYNWGPYNKGLYKGIIAAYTKRVAPYYDVENSGSYSSGFTDCLTIDNVQISETIEVTGSYVGEGSSTGDDTSNSAYFRNGGGTTYHTYNQTAYGDFWTNNGGGPTACAIVLSGLTNQDREPTEIYPNLEGYTNFEKDLIPLLTQYQISSELYFNNKTQTGNYYGEVITESDRVFILEQLAKGYPIIVYTKPGGVYMGNQYNGHFMTLLGAKENGDVYVADPGGWGRDGWISLEKLSEEALLTAYLVCKP